jgi:hypothetical protein
MRDQLAAEGVDVSFVAVREDPPTGRTVALSRGGDRAILTALGAVASLTAAGRPGSAAGRRAARARQLVVLAPGSASGRGWGRCFPPPVRPVS